ncbi:MAG: hypothetical protein IPN70_02060 [Candidatus Moraniibacteriota bacterium]|nr:MAG: hypothetical protein IPN70_02060 [Candidatus Moranbacteria bacterium]
MLNKPNPSQKLIKNQINQSRTSSQDWLKTKKTFEQVAFFALLKTFFERQGAVEVVV